MKKAVSLTEVLIVVGILSIIAAIAIPQFAKMKMRAQLQEVKTYVEIVRKAAKYAQLNGKPYDSFAAIEVSIPANSYCTYAIIDVSGVVTLYVRRKGTTTALYYCILPDGAGVVTGISPENSYLQKMSLP